MQPCSQIELRAELPLLPSTDDLVARMKTNVSMPPNWQESLLRLTWADLRTI